MRDALKRNDSSDSVRFSIDKFSTLSKQQKKSVYKSLEPDCMHA